MARHGVNRLWHTVIGRGALMLILGVAALIWPEEVLIAAMMSVGVTASLLGLYELRVASHIILAPSGRRLALVHGATATIFGVLTVIGPRLALRLALGLIAGWLMMYATWVLAVVLLLQPRSAARHGLLLWATFDVAIAAICLFYRQATIFTLLYFGAAYAALFGAWQILLGVSLRRAGKRDPESVDRPALVGHV